MISHSFFFAAYRSGAEIRSCRYRPSCVRTWYFSSLDQPFSIFSTDSQLSLPRISSNTLMPPFTAQKALSYESAFSHNQYW